MLVLAVVNLSRPRQIGPMMSEVLTLGVPDADGEVVLITPAKDAKIGGAPLLKRLAPFPVARPGPPGHHCDASWPCGCKRVRLSSNRQSPVEPGRLKRGEGVRHDRRLGRRRNGPDLSLPALLLSPSGVTGRASALLDGGWRAEQYTPSAWPSIGTSWTFFARFGWTRTHSGLDFLAVYLGPILVIRLVGYKLIQRIVSIAEGHEHYLRGRFVACAARARASASRPSSA